MAVFKCQMCGGDLLPSTEDPRIGICQYCDSRMPLPTVEDEKTLNRFNRANHYRMSSDFDRAKDAYEKLLEDFPDSAQAYWGLLLSRYGIEYVKDPKTGRQLPTCHRLQLHSIQDDPDYQQALKYASVSARAEYQRQAAEISRIQKESLALSAKEPPYDIFICYKEQDDHTRQRTRDSVIAQDIYTALVKEGYKVFFSRITLESRLGKQYEPIIYAALRSAKVMLVVTTSREHCSAVWVKNEWSRFLDMMAEDPGKKALIPVFSGMDAYDLPEQFESMQALDYSKIGAMQDLLHGIQKLIKNLGQNTTGHGAQASETVPLFQRIALFLEAKNYSQAIAYCNRVLDQSPSSSKAYFYLAMCDLQCPSENHLLEICQEEPEQLLENQNFHYACRFASPQEKKELLVYASRSFQSLKRKYDGLIEDAREKADGLKRQRDSQHDSLQNVLHTIQTLKEDENNWQLTLQEYTRDADDLEHKLSEKQYTTSSINKEYGYFSITFPTLKYLYALLAFSLGLFSILLILDVFINNYDFGTVFGAVILIVVSGLAAFFFASMTSSMFQKSYPTKHQKFKEASQFIRDKTPQLKKLKQQCKQAEQEYFRAQSKSESFAAANKSALQGYDRIKEQAQQADQAVQTLQDSYMSYAQQARKLGVSADLS